MDARTGTANDARIPDLERTIAGVRQRLGDPSGALNSAQEAVKLEPLAAASYGRLAEALAAAGRPDDAAIALMQGILLTRDADLRQGLVKLYQMGGLADCALLPGTTGLNRDCPLVHRHLCSASRAVIHTWLGKGQQSSADETRASAVRDFGCTDADLR
jgi:hypothetical protein